MSSAHSGLSGYGWRPDRNHELPSGSQPARVIRHDGHSLLGVKANGTLVLRASLRLDPQPTVGDWVAVPIDVACSVPLVPVAPAGLEGVTTPADSLGVQVSSEASEPLDVIAVLQRRSLLRRQSADAVGEQALAANVDLVLITCGVDRPLKAGRVQRVAAQVWDAGATPVLVLTKAADPDTYDLPRLELEHPGIRVIATAALEGVGTDELRSLLADRTSVLIGESGAGKSTLTNVLLGADSVRVGSVRAGDHKGRHTTTARQAHLLPGALGGVIIDTPGIRTVGLAADSDAVDAVFADLTAFASDCRFSDCGHLAEPGCAVLAAIDDGLLAQERYDGWRRLQREVAAAELRASPAAARARNRQFGRMAREAMALKGRGRDGGVPRPEAGDGGDPGRRGR